ncbi:pentapeptide repeat-containing protein [Mucilaginibacter terrae]|uniref:Fluoroquinolone resistance protein n=1 Tax=Mucilaginibacter terrae TaxID=1955052 RepID=A0ABU3GY70_9SPHI|nr:pentapeptide repeat-containing protein [Mucilaginibacter terrae]MDT3404708.1 fluoroquinolone resistance protein [Mucilaginibacter terrae]
MQQLNHDNKIFEKITYTGQIINGREFQECAFKQCDLSESNFGNNKFIDCVFEGCNLSMLKLANATLSNVVFKDCKILGVNFHECSDFLFSVEFDNCVLDYASFAGKKMPKTKFNRSSVKEVSFIQANLSGSKFADCDLDRALFNRTDLTAVDFSTAKNFDIDPEINTLKKATFAADSLRGLLTRHQIKIV